MAGVTAAHERVEIETAVVRRRASEPAANLLARSQLL